MKTNKEVKCMGDKCGKNLEGEVQYYPRPGVILCERCNLKEDKKELVKQRP